MLCPLSCRGRPDQHPCCPSLTIGGIRDRRFQFCTLLTDQQPKMRLAAGNIRNCAMHAAAMDIVPELEATLSPPVQCSFSAKACSSNRATLKHRAVRTINITRRVLVSPERSVSSSIIVADRRHQNGILAGSYNVIAHVNLLGCNYLMKPLKRPDPFSFCHEVLASMSRTRTPFFRMSWEVARQQLRPQFGR